MGKSILKNVISKKYLATLQIYWPNGIFFQKIISDPAYLGWPGGDFWQKIISDPGQLLGTVKYS